MQGGTGIGAGIAAQRRSRDLRPLASAPLRPFSFPRTLTSMTTRPHTDIRNLPPNAYVEGVYSIVNPQIGTTRGGKPYLKCLLRDAIQVDGGITWD